jgi:hypothetical protein
MFFCPAKRFAECHAAPDQNKNAVTGAQPEKAQMRLATAPALR